MRQENVEWSAVIGGMAGATAGGVITQYMDDQAKELSQYCAAQRIDDGIVVTLSDKVLFDFDSAKLKKGSRNFLHKMAGVLMLYDKTTLTVVGHTDNMGSRSYNIPLSERRARAVSDYLADQGVRQGRLRLMGLGFERPVASNDSAEGRALNRRVEIHIAPAKELREEARPQKG